MRAVAFSPYEMKFLAEEPSVREQTRKGVLLRIKDENGNSGYAGLHMWPIDMESIQGRLALRAAEQDLSLRRAGKSAWDGFEDIEIENNYLFFNFSAATGAGDEAMRKEIAEALKKGFRTFKVKVGRNPGIESPLLRSLVKINSEARWRLDFNSLLTPQLVDAFFFEWTEEEISRIEYLEDPCVYEKNYWNELNKKIPLALDQANPFGFEGLNPGSFQHLILKPAIQDIDQWLPWARTHNLKITVTSFMDHPLGAAEAFRQALEIKKSLGQDARLYFNVSGLRTQFLFSSTEFSRQLETSEPTLLRPKGTGLGFDSLLKGLTWFNLN